MSFLVVTQRSLQFSPCRGRSDTAFCTSRSTQGPRNSHPSRSRWPTQSPPPATKQFQNIDSAVFVTTPVVLISVCELKEAIHLKFLSFCFLPVSVLRISARQRLPAELSGFCFPPFFSGPTFTSSRLSFYLFTFCMHD